jgi:hypothetical protein
MASSLKGLVGAHLRVSPPERHELIVRPCREGDGTVPTPASSQVCSGGELERDLSQVALFPAEGSDAQV